MKTDVPFSRKPNQLSDQTVLFACDQKFFQIQLFQLDTQTACFRLIRIQMLAYMSSSEIDKLFSGTI